MILKELLVEYERIKSNIKQNPILNEINGLSKLLEKNTISVCDDKMSFQFEDQGAISYENLTKANHNIVLKKYLLVIDKELRIIKEQEEAVYLKFEESFNKIKDSLTNTLLTTNWTKESVINEYKKNFGGYADFMINGLLTDKMINNLKNNKSIFDFSEPYQNNKRPTTPINNTGLLMYKILKSKTKSIINSLEKQKVMINDSGFNESIELPTSAKCNLCLKDLISEVAVITCDDCHCYYHLGCINGIAEQKGKYIFWKQEHEEVEIKCWRNTMNLKEIVDKELYEVFSLKKSSH
ncbi:MAG: PHD finger domain-containing protein [Candidatus Nanoarchaeia archaeon]|jgi:hypothetical protein